VRPLLVSISLLALQFLVWWQGKKYSLVENTACFCAVNVPAVCTTTTVAVPKGKSK